MRRYRTTFDAIVITPSTFGYKFMFIIVALFTLTFTQNEDSTAKSTILFAQAVTTGPTLSPTSRPTARPTTRPSPSPTTFPTSYPTLSPTVSPTKSPFSSSGPLSVENIVMTLNGLNPLPPQDIYTFETNIANYIEAYYSETNSNCNNCLQKDIDIFSVNIQVTNQNPRYVDDNRRQRRSLALGSPTTSSSDRVNHRYRYLQASGPTQISLTYTQTTIYRKNNPTMADPNIEDIVKEPFNNVLKRKDFLDFLKQNAGPSFQTLSLVLAPTIQEPSGSIFGIGVIAAIASGGLVILVLVVFLICKCSRRSGGKSNYSYDDHHPVSTKSRRPNGHPSNGNHARHPSQVEVQDLKDEVSTMVDPTPQYGVFNEGKSFTGYTPR
jgi:hypothetical protein